MNRTAIALSLISLAGTACSTPSAEGGRRDEGRARAQEAAVAATPQAAPLPWPTTFEEPAVLMAARVVITGPEGLREHAALLQDPEHHAYEEKTTAEGFVRRTVLRSEVEYLAPIRCSLDKLEIFAEREIVVLERPGPAELTIEATGDVYWRASSTGEERRSAEMRLVGK
jgi:hypothetical protein